MSRNNGPPPPDEMQMAVAVLLSTAGRAPDSSEDSNYVWFWYKEQSYRGGDSLRVDYWWRDSGFARNRRDCWTVYIGQVGGNNRRKAGPGLVDVLDYLRRPDVRKTYGLDEI